MAAPGPHAHAYHGSLERSSFPDASALPPTPPDEDAQVPVRVETPAMEAPRRPVTPPAKKNVKRPLTPEYTPPSMGLKVPRPPLAHHHSSAAESFRTAREEQSRELLNGFGGEEEAGRGQDDEDAREGGADGTPDLRTEGSAQTLRTAFSRRAESEVNGTGGAFAPSPRIVVPEEEPWKEMPGAFRGTPSTTSSRNQSARPKQYLHSPSTPSTGSSPRFPKFKRFPDSEPASEASSRDVARVKNYEEDPDSPLMQSPSQRREQVDGDDWEKHVSYVHSDDEWEERREEEEDDEPSQRGGAREDDKAKRKPNGHGEDNWEKHVSYIASDDEEEVPKKNHAAGKVLEEARRNLGLPSPRLRGNGRQIERGGEQRTNGLGIHADPVRVKPQESRDDSPSQSRRHALHRTGHLQEVDASPPNVTIRKRVKHAISPEEDFGAGRKEREARKLSWLREQAETLASHDIPAEFIATPPRDSNDLVYKHIQKANMDKYDAIKAGRAVEARVIPADETRSRHALRHVSKKHSLRSLSESNDGSPTATRRNQSLRHKGGFDPRLERREDSRRHEGGRSVSSPISQHHSLRHEKRPLSGFGRPMQSSNAPMSLDGSETSPKLVQESFERQKRVPKLRHASLPVHLSKQVAQPNGVSSRNVEQRRDQGHGLRRASKEHRLETEVPSLRQTYEQDETSPPADMMSPSSQHFLGLGQHQRNRSLATPMSASAWSDRTEMEVCEAKNVAIFPHSNESVLVVQHGTKAGNRDDAEEASDAIEDGSIDGDRLEVPSLFTANLPKTPAPPTIAVNGESIHTVDSPLTNPRDPPMPPVIKFIPPTPNEEDDRELGLDDTADDGSILRRPSLAKRARRYSDIVVRPILGRTLSQRSHRIRQSPSMHEKRDERLHPNWVPTSFWQDDDEDEEDDFSDPEDEPFIPLPAGGDTSEHPKQKFPRKMSVRMPGFRGTGGFLLGNSLGVDRHGTNNRRHHVQLRRGSLDPQSAGRSLRNISSADSLHRFMSNGAPRRSFAIPGTKTRVQFMGFKAVKERLHKFRAARNEAEKERRRAELREQIGVRIVHGDGH